MAYSTSFYCSSTISSYTTFYPAFDRQTYIVYDIFPDKRNQLCDYSSQRNNTQCLSRLFYAYLYRQTNRKGGGKRGVKMESKEDEINELKDKISRLEDELDTLSYEKDEITLEEIKTEEKLDDLKEQLKDLEKV